MNNIQAIILDLDGTLLDDEKRVSARTIELLKSIKDEIKIIPASARQFCRIKPYLEEIGLLDNNNYTICLNGSLIVNNEEEVLFSQHIDEDVIVGIDNFILSSGIEWTYYLYDSRITRSKITNIEEFACSNKVYKIVCLASPDVICKLRSSLPSYLQEKMEVTSSELDRIEFVKKGMTKVDAIDMLMKRLEIDRELIVAIGDGDNDNDMLKYAGIGIAMQNAPDNVKINADLITKYSNNEDGVYHIINELMSKGIVRKRNL